VNEHKTVLLKEAVEGLAPQAAGVYVDCTFGRGGHSRELLRRIGPSGRVIALDRDEEAVAAAEGVTDQRFTIVHARFGELRRVLDELQVKEVDGVLFDLGVSSPQIDDGRRGFSFRADAPLDMRMDRTRGETAAQWLARADEAQIKGVIRDYGEERFAGAIAKAIVAARSGAPVATTAQLARIVGAAVRTREPGQDPATRTFQALRIHINQELEELQVALPQALAALRIGGRLAAISFHSLEDRIVKRFMRELAQPRLPERLPLRAAELPQPVLKLAGKAQRAGASEIAINPRARSAVLRVAEKSGSYAAA
jgi:16S rRNA (cytosine1402-N4)-methyltransferase